MEKVNVSFASFNVFDRVMLRLHIKCYYKYINHNIVKDYRCHHNFTCRTLNSRNVIVYF